MHKPITLLVGAAALFCGITSASAVQTNTVTSQIFLTAAKSQWNKQWFLTGVTVTGSLTEQFNDLSRTNFIGGAVETSKVSNKSILGDNVPKGSKLYLASTGPGSSSLYPKLVAWDGKEATIPVDIQGWDAEVLYVSNPEDQASTVNGALVTVPSGRLIVPNTLNPNVPKNEQKITGNTCYGFNIPGALPVPAGQASYRGIRGWGPFTADFKTLFKSNGRIQLNGSVDVLRR